MSNNTDMSYRSQGQFETRLDVCLDSLRTAIFLCKVQRQN